MLRLRFIAVLTLAALALVIAPPEVNQAKPLQGWYTTTAYDITVIFYDPLPHYAARLSGDYGSNQHYLGSGGDAVTAPYSGGIANWDWYPPDYQSGLLLPKTWLADYLFQGAWTPSNYQTYVFH